MNVEIRLEKHGDAECSVLSCEKPGMCWIELKEGNRDISATVSIEDLKLALRKLSVK